MHVKLGICQGIKLAKQYAFVTIKLQEKHRKPLPSIMGMRAFEPGFLLRIKFLQAQLVYSEERLSQCVYCVSHFEHYM